MMTRTMARWLVGSLLLTFSAAAAAQSRVERIGAPASLPDALKQEVEAKGYHVTLDGGWTADFWFVRLLKTVAKDAPGAVYPELTNGEFVGVAEFPKGFTDYRGQKVASGAYSLRYQLLPADGNHMGVSPNPDFLLLVPAAGDPDPAVALLYKKLIALSCKAAGSSHPAVLALEAPGDPGTVNKDAQGTVTFSVQVPASGISAGERLTLVVKGSAPQ
jgi:hypothetical protein